MIANVADVSEPLHVLHHGVEFVAVDDENASAVRRFVNGVFLDRDVAVGAAERGHELIVITRDVNDRHAFARFAQDFLDDVVMLLRPVATTTQRPDVDQIADDIKFVAIVIAQKLQERICVARARAEMDIGNPEARRQMAPTGSVS